MTEDVVEAKELWEFECPFCQEINRVEPYPGMVDAFPVQLSCNGCGTILYVRPVLAQRPEFKEYGKNGETGN